MRDKAEQMDAENKSWVRSSVGRRRCLEAFFHGSAYAPHRHDTYTLALTVHGVQSFNYRGELRHSLPGEVVVLHPDELHDGQAGTDIGFGYRSINIAPSEVQTVLEGRTLPFLEGGVTSDAQLRSLLMRLLTELDQPLHEDDYTDALFDVVTRLEKLAGYNVSTRHDYDAAERARLYIQDQLEDGFRMTDLERETGQNRWQLSRDFRAAFGTSPYRYLVQRRLEQAIAMIGASADVSQIAYKLGFSDQSHLIRHFKNTYGFTPQAWVRLLRAN